MKQHFLKLLFTALALCVQPRSIHAQWTQIGLDDTLVISLSGNYYTLLAGTFGSGIFRYDLFDMDWTKVTSNYLVWCIEKTSTHSFIAGTMNVGALRSLDDGMDWSQTSLHSEMTSFTMCRDLEGRERLFGSAAGNVFYSFNGGSTWNGVGNTNQIDLVCAFPVDDGTSRFNIIGGTGSKWIPLGGTPISSDFIFLSTDYGSTWARADSGLPFAGVDAFTCFADSTGRHSLLAGSWGGLFVSTNGGAYWSRVNCGTTQTYPVSFATYTDQLGGVCIFVGNRSYGVALSTDYGTTWVSANSGFPSYVDVWAIFVSNDFLYAGTSDGVWQRPLSEMITVMPVELTEFRGSCEKNRVHLIWTTATEKNDYGFDIEKLANPAVGWKNIGFIRGQGTTNTPHHYWFDDVSPTYCDEKYRLKQIDGDGSFSYSKEIRVKTTSATGEAEIRSYPNPFNPSTTITYDLPAIGHVTLKVYDALGRVIATLVDEEKSPGAYSLLFDASTHPAGVYFCQLTTGTSSKTKKIVLVK